MELLVRNRAVLPRIMTRSTNCATRLAQDKEPNPPSVAWLVYVDVESKAMVEHSWQGPGPEYRKHAMSKMDIPLSNQKPRSWSYNIIICSISSIERMLSPMNV